MENNSIIVNAEKPTKKDYNKKYYESFKDKEKDKKYVCDICNKQYTYYGKSKHIKSAYHNLAITLKNNQPAQPAHNV